MKQGFPGSAPHSGRPSPCWRTAVISIVSAVISVAKSQDGRFLPYGVGKGLRRKVKQLLKSGAVIGVVFAVFLALLPAEYHVIPLAFYR